jgi:hypothetical protein
LAGHIRKSQAGPLALHKDRGADSHIHGRKWGCHDDQELRSACIGLLFGCSGFLLSAVALDEAFLTHTGGALHDILNRFAA